MATHACVCVDAQWATHQCRSAGLHNHLHPSINECHNPTHHDCSVGCIHGVCKCLHLLVRMAEVIPGIAELPLQHPYLLPQWLASRCLLLQTHRGLSYATKNRPDHGVADKVPSMLTGGTEMPPHTASVYTIHPPHMYTTGCVMVVVEVAAWEAKGHCGLCCLQYPPHLQPRNLSP